jgi:hypothetical protein
MNKPNFDYADMLKSMQEAATSEKTSHYLKMKPGNHHLRVVPVIPKFSDANGTPIQNLPYLEVVQHAFNVMDNSGREQTKFVLCYNDIVKNVKTKAKSLVEQGKLTKDDFSQHQKYGCPACAAVRMLSDAKVLDTVWKGSLPKTSYTINVLERASNSIKVWNMSKKIFQMVVAPFLQTIEHGKNIWDVNSGMDVVVNAEGTGFGRRYTATYQMIESPLNPPQDAVYHNLFHIYGESFLNYGPMADLVQQAFASHLSTIGKTVPGTTISNVFDSTPQAVPSTLINEVMPPAQQVNKVVQDVGDGLFMSGNVLIGPDGKALF